MCFSTPKAPKPPKPVQPPTRQTAEDIADMGRKKRSTRMAYANWAFASSQEGASDYGKGAQIPSLSAGTAPQLGT